MTRSLETNSTPFGKLDRETKTALLVAFYLDGRTLTVKGHAIRVSAWFDDVVYQIAPLSKETTE